MAILRRVGLPLLVIIVIAGLVFLASFLLVGSQTPATVTYTVQRGSISAIVRTTGKVEAVRSVRLSFRTGDLLRRTLVKPGDYVPSGTLLMELDTGALQRQLDQAQTQREIARFNLSASVEKARNDPNATPASPSELYSLARQSELADTQLAQARAALDNARIYAPFDGTILSVDSNEGDYVNPGQAVMTFGDLSRLQVRASIDELDVGNVAVGQAVSFSLDAFPGKTFDGTVTLVYPNPTTQSGSTVYPAIISFTRPNDLYLRPGMAANLSITSVSRTNVLVVPNRALETIGLDRYVTLLNGDGSTEKVPVVTGLTNADQTEIISGLNEGAKISLPR
jgi:RND family efflux transporter MFP subunit